MADNKVNINIEANMKSNVPEESEKIVKNFDEISDSADKTNKSAKDLNGIIDNIVNGTLDVSGTLSSIGSSVLSISAGFKVLEKVVDIINTYFDTWDDTFDGLVDGAKDFSGVLGSEIKDTLGDILDLAKSAGDGLASGFSEAVELVKDFIDLLDKAEDEIKELANEGVELNQKYFILSRTLGTEGAKQANGVLGKLADMYNMDSDNLIDGFNKIVRMVDKLGLSVNKTSAAITNMALDLSAASGTDFTQITQELENAISMGKLSVKGNIAKFLMVSDQELAEFKSLNTELERAQYLMDRASRNAGAMSKWMETSAGKVEKMNQQFSVLNSNVQRLSVGIMAKLAPTIIFVTKLVNRLVNALAKLLNIDMQGFDNNYDGPGDWVGSNGSNNENNENNKNDSKADKKAKSNDKLSKSLDKVKKSADEAKRSVASFDDVIQLPEANENDMFSNLDDLGDTDSLEDIEDILGDILDELPEISKALNFNGFDLDLDDTNSELSELEKKLSEIIDLVEQGKFYKAGKKLNEVLKSLLVGVPWDEIKKKAQEVGKGLSDFINGFFEDESLGYEIGKALVESINTAFEFLSTFIHNTKFDEIGQFISESILGFFENLDSGLIGNTVISAFDKALDFIKGFLDDMFEHKIFKDVPDEIDTGWELVGYKIGDLLNHIFDGFDDNKIIDAIVGENGILNGIITSVSTFFDTVETTELGEKLWNIFDSMFNYVIEHFDPLLSKLTKTFVGGINKLFSKLDGKEIGNGIGKVLASVINNVGYFLENIDFHEIGSTIGKSLNGIIRSIDPVQLADDIFMLLDSIFDMIGSLLDEISVDNLIERFRTFLSRLFGNIVENSGEWAENIKPLTDLVIGLIDTFFDTFESSHLLAAIQNFLDESGIFDLISRWAEAQFQLKVDEFFIKLRGKLPKIADAIDMLLAVIIGGPIGVGLNILSKKLFNWLKENWDDLKDSIEESADELVENVVEGWESLINGAKTAISNLWDSIVTGIHNLFNNADDEVATDAEESGNAMLKSVKGSIGDVLLKWLNDHGLNIGNKIDKLVKSLKEKVTKVGDWFKDKFEKFKDFVSGLRDGIDDTVESIIDLFKDMWDALCDFLNPEKLAAKGSEFIGGFLDGVAEAWQAVKDFFGSLKLPEIHIPSPSISSPSVKVNVPKMATGGIVTSSSFVNVGEAGREAILPLDSNTAWMDGLAEKISSKMISNSSTENNTVNIDLSSINKDIYTRSEMLEFGRQVVEALKLCGFNVAVY
jgi:hypothetical protein